MTRFCDFARQAYFSIRHKGKDFARAFFLLYWASVVTLSERPVLRTIPHCNSEQSVLASKMFNLHVFSLRTLFAFPAPV